MDLKELKNIIETKSELKLPLVLKYADNDFLASQYIDVICKNYNKEKIVIEALSEIPDDDMFDTDANSLYVYQCDKLEEEIVLNDNLIIICKSINYEPTVPVIDMSMKILPWQIEDYIKLRLPGLSTEQIQWLCNITNYSIHRLNQECKKLELFPKDTQKIIFENLVSEGGYSDLTSITIFDYTQAMVNKDYKKVSDILSNLETIDVEGTGVVTLLLRQFKLLIEASFYALWKSDFKCTEKQFNYLKRHCLFNQNQLINIYEFLTGIDARIKNGDLTLKDNANHLTVNNMLVDYLTINLIKLGNC